MNKIYQRPEIWVEEWQVACQVLAGTQVPANEVIQTAGNAGIGYGGGGTGPARAGVNNLWDDGEDYGSDNL